MRLRILFLLFFAMFSTCSIFASDKILFQNISVTTSNTLSLNDANNTVNEVGLDGDMHTIYGSWVGVPDDSNTVWIRYDFDKVYELDNMLVWNYNHPFYRYGFKEVLIEYSEDGYIWQEHGVFTFAEATRESDYIYNTTIDFNSIAAQSIRLTAYSNWGGIDKWPYYGISELRFNYTDSWPIEEKPPVNLITSSTIGGYIELPGEGDFTYDYGTEVTLNAISDSYFVFKNWTGPVADSNSPITSIIAVSNETIRANFQTTQSTLYVGTEDPNDPNDDYLIPNIQDALEVIPDNNEVTIIIAPGTYTGNLILTEKVHLSTNSDDPNCWPVITAQDSNLPVITITGTNSLQGFIIRSGLDGIVCDGNDITLENCIIAGNKGYGISIYDANNISIVNCTITGNGSDEIDGGGIGIWDSNNISIVNTIVCENFPNNINTLSGTEPTISYSCTSDPYFAINGYWADINDVYLALEPNEPNAIWIDGDYHLMSEAGRFVPDSGTWVNDLITSPYINTGDPSYSVGKEPQPNGGIINIGAYGGTYQAAKKEE